VVQTTFIDHGRCDLRPATCDLGAHCGQALAHGRHLDLPNRFGGFCTDRLEAPVGQQQVGQHGNTPPRRRRSVAATLDNLGLPHRISASLSRAPLAQLAEQLTLNQRVPGSSPGWRTYCNDSRLQTTKSPGFRGFFRFHIR
jgi:hypothetical protein